MQKSESIIKLTAALIKAKRLFSPLIRNQENPGFKRGGQVSKYADLAAVIEATETPLLDNGLVVTQFPHNEGERVGVQTALLHESGEFLEHTFTLPIFKQDAQTGVGAVTYARRVSIKAVLGISDEDDDGNTATGTGVAPKTSTTAPKSSTATAPVQPPKAEIPKELPGTSATQAAATALPASGATAADGNYAPASTEMPTEAQLVEFRKQFAALNNDLATAGLKAGRGLPIARKVRAFLLASTNTDDPAKITLAQWTTFFHKIELTKQGEGGIKRLVTVVNEANGITEEKK